MIQKIKGVSNFGIFKEIDRNPNYDDFNKLNLFYGLNGSGKSTLSHLYSLLESKGIISRFPESKWNFIKSDDTIISESDDLESDLNVKVFDKGFIERNLNWNDTIEGILIVSEDKNIEIKILKEKKKVKSIIELDIEEFNKKLNGSKKGKGLIRNNNNFLSESAKNIKQKFKLIDVEDTYLSNYNKIKIEAALDRNKINIKKDSITSNKIQKLAETIKPQDKNKIERPDTSSLLELQKGFDKILIILNSKITSEVIGSLKEDFEKSDWVKNGLNFHKEDSDCSFCGNVISKERIIKLNNHFSDSFKNNQEEISRAKTWIQDIKFANFPLFNDLYKEYQSSYVEIKNNIEKEISKINKLLEGWNEALNNKSSNPFELEILKISKYEDSNLRKLYSDALKIIDSHNKKHLSAATIIKEAKESLEIEYIKDEIKRYNFYKEKSLELNTLTEQRILRDQLENLKSEIKKLTALVSTEALGADKFNTDLYKFLGRKDISLEPQEKGGYKIERNGDPNTKGNQLSEGEKTAIAFVYFINKISEEDNKISDTVVVVDDPISSFDSNNLFSSYSYLKLHCNQAKQLFILTHNFNYYRLVRDWFDIKNKGQRQKYNKDPSKPKSICNIYSIESSFDSKQIRSSIIKNADSTLLEYSSEYHYLFKRLITFSQEKNLDLDNAYLSANASRKILETFLKFKFPKKSKDFRQLLAKAIKNTSLKEKEEYIYRFINKYSHAQDFDNDSSDNKLDEGINVTKDILSLIREIDETHYDEMLDVCQN